MRGFPTPGWLLLSLIVGLGCSETSGDASLFADSGGGEFGGNTGGSTGGSTGGGETGLETGGEGSPGSCVDQDGDAYGVNCLPGADCDDNNPHFQSDCPDCSVANFSGCPCVSQGAVKLCYGADPNLADVGVCQVGERTCDFNGFWSDCVGEVLPEEESCDGLDNNCDGEVDEGVLSVCGDCDKYCQVDKMGPGTAQPFALDSENSQAVESTPEGWVTLDENAFSLKYIWIANSAESTISKLDTETGLEQGRYAVCSDPSRTSVDQKGDCWFGCRGDGKVGKIRNNVTTCVDKNGNGQIDTSQDLNGDGTIQTNEMQPSQQDECLLFLVQPNGGSAIRAVGVDSDNQAWVGQYDSLNLMRLEEETGALLQTINVGVNPYGLAIDPDGIIWVSSRAPHALTRVNPLTGSVGSLTPPGCLDAYGIAVDSIGNVWIANSWCSSSGDIWRYHPPTGSWSALNVGHATRGVAASPDGYIYAALDSDSAIAKIDALNMVHVGTASLGGGKNPVGVAVDPAGYVWAVNQGASSASKVDPDALVVVHEQPVGSGPYTYSDMTGASFFNDLAPQGNFSQIYSGKEGARIHWKSLSIDYYAPADTWIDVRLRTADSPEELAAKPWTSFLGPFPPTTFPVDLTELLKKKSDFIEVDIWLHSDSDTLKPVVKNLKIEYTEEDEE